MGGVAAGGAVANEFGGTLNVARSVFKDNLSSGILIGVGGAIASDMGPTLDGEGTPRATLNVAGSTFDGNSAEAAFNNPDAAGELAAFSGFAFGGAISSLATDARILNSRFINNSAQGGAGTPGENGGFANGGAIFSDDFSPFGVRDSFMEMRGSTFVGNAVTGGAAGPGGEVGGGAAGGAVSMSISFFEETGRIVNSNFSRNSATGGPGATGDWRSAARSAF